MRKKNKHNEVEIKDILINEISFGICYCVLQGWMEILICGCKNILKNKRTYGRHSSSEYVDDLHGRSLS